MSGAGGLMEAAKEEELAAEEEAEEALEEDVWALMKAPWDEDAASEAGMDDDFVLKAPPTLPPTARAQPSHPTLSPHPTPRPSHPTLPVCSRPRGIVSRRSGCRCRQARSSM